MRFLDPDPLAPGALRAATAATLVILGAALVGAAVRLLPWALDPSIPWATLRPFAWSLLAVAVEAALLTGWPVGWALATAKLVERGEAGVLASLGESPPRTVLRLAPQAFVFLVCLAIASVVLGREAAAPGRVVASLLAEGRAACERSPSGSARGGRVHAVPFVGASWLCGASGPRLAGRTPMGGAVFSAAEARVSGDLRRLELDDARVALPGRGAIHVDTLVLRGMTPWAQASAIAPWLRALVVALAGVASSAAVVLALLRLRRRAVGVVGAVAVGAAGPLAALLTLRALEVRVPDAPGAWLILLALVPLASIAGVASSSAVVTLLPVARRAGTK